jgi:hypothetical protein
MGRVDETVRRPCRPRPGKTVGSPAVGIVEAEDTENKRIVREGESDASG